jgi:hypothetical protein
MTGTKRGFPCQNPQAFTVRFAFNHLLLNTDCFCMKNKFHLNKRPSSRFSSNASGASVQAAALIDERYLGWLMGQQPQPPQKPLQRSAFNSVFAAMARAVQPDAYWLRTVLFTDHQPTELTDDVVLRMVPGQSADGGLGLVRSMGLELTQLAARGAIGTVLVACDDERLIPYVDEAQWRGLKVVLLTDESSQDPQKLMQDDPSWARLLMQADRRLVLSDNAWQALTTEGATFSLRTADVEFQEDSTAQTPTEGDDDWRNRLEVVIQEWWDDETEDARLDLHDEMLNSQGVPAETDRHLLLRARRELGRTLSFTEKKVMRELIRQTVLAQPPTAEQAEA